MAMSCPYNTQPYHNIFPCFLLLVALTLLELWFFCWVLEGARFEPFSCFFIMFSRLSREGCTSSLPFNRITSFLSLSTSSLSSLFSIRFWSIKDWLAWETHLLAQDVFNWDGVQVCVWVWDWDDFTDVITTSWATSSKMCDSTSSSCEHLRWT